jgi:hypothetical protein
MFMAKKLEEFLSEIDPTDHQFHPRPRYSREGDCVIFYFEESESYGDRVDGILTVYRALDDDRIVGCQLKGIATLLERANHFKFEIEIDDHGVRFSALLLVSNLIAEQPQYQLPRRRKMYEDLLNRAGGLAVSIEEHAAAL